MKTAILLVALVIAVSGCVFPGSFFGQDVLSVQHSTKTDGASDVLTVNDILTIPSPPLLPNQDVFLSFVLRNDDKLKPAKGVKVELFNAPLFRDPASKNPCNAVPPAGSPEYCQPNPEKAGTPRQCSRLSPCDILPGAEEQISFNLLSFSQSGIANVKQDTTLNFRTEYEFDSALTYLLPVVNIDEVIKRQRSGKKTEITIAKTHSSGPVQVDVELIGAPYVLADFPATLSFAVRNVGSGTIKNSRIVGNTNPISVVVDPLDPAAASTIFVSRSGTTDALVIIFPQEFEILEYPGQNSIAGSPGGFMCDSTNKCWNTGEITIYKDESRVSMRFKVALKKSALDDMRRRETPFRSFQIKAFAFYRYELRNSVAATINPFENV